MGAMLTPSQADVLCALVQVDNVADASRLMGITPVTMRRHIQGIRERLGLRPSADLYKIVLTAHLRGVLGKAA